MHLTAPSEVLDFSQAMGVSQKLVDQYFGLWAIEPQRFQGLVEHVRSINLVAHIQANRDTFQAMGEPQAAADRKPYQLTREGVAIVSIDGPMQKYASSFSGATSTVRVRQQVAAAMRDEDVAAILLTIDSPGGTVAGTQDLADAINQAKQRKPVWALVEDMAASAAYWVASQADKVFANQPTAMVGSIGTFAVLTDLSMAAEKLGAKVHVVRAGQFKGAGVPGTAIEEDHLAEWQRLVNAMNAEFLNGVAAGRSMSAADVQAVADGRVHPANEAVGMRLIDGVQSFDQTLAELTSELREGQSMTKSDATPAPQPATLAELKAAFPTASSDFVLQQLEANATLLVATQAFAADQAAQVQQLQQQLAERDKQVTTIEQSAGKLKLPGVKPLAIESQGDDSEAEAAADPVASYDQLVRAKVKSGADRRSACLAVARENPQLHQAFLLATNGGMKAQRLIAEKYDAIA